MSTKKVISQLEKNKKEIEKLDQELEHLKHKKQKYQAQKSAEERKIRTRNLIQRGAILESVQPIFKKLSNEELQAALEKILHCEFAIELLDEYEMS